MAKINITVENHIQAKMLVKWLHEIKFVKKISFQKEVTSEGNIKKISKILSHIKSQQILPELTDPVQFQNQLRNEW